MLKILNSKIDKSVNFVEEQLKGFLESRFVRREKKHFICYLSSHTGCFLNCKFCHLTTTNQTSFISSTHNDFISQAINVFKHYKTQKEENAQEVRFSFMARGEPLLNKTILKNADDLFIDLGKMAKNENLRCKFNISTILPNALNKELTEIFKFIHPTIYYSLYSLNPDFREKWLPNALNPEEAFRLLKDYQSFSKKIIKIHFSFIKDENDNIENIKEICDALNRHKILAEFNLVRYNPYSINQGEESTTKVIQRNLDYIKDNFKGLVKEIPRVGPDIYASCGMFSL